MLVPATLPSLWLVARAPGAGRLMLARTLLVVPHVIVLAFVVLWPVALVAIVFTGRYPRAIFNVGAMRRGASPERYIR